MNELDNQQQVLTEQEKFNRIREYTAVDSATAHYPVPGEWVSWLLQKYAGLLNAIVPLAVRKYMYKPFDDVDDQAKLTMIYWALEGGNPCGMPTPMVPGSWVAWLLAKYDQENNRAKVNSILQATENGARLSPRDLDIVTFAVKGGLSQKGWEEFEALHGNVRSGEYLDPHSPKFPWLNGIKHLTQDHAGGVYWKGQKVGYSDLNKSHQDSERTAIKQLAVDCIRAETTGSPLPGILSQPWPSN